MLKDSAHRALATDPTQSFIVQAPAGSGKTEILTQRFLRLLGTVTAPEHIVALTFTRKAASEMRERILHALHCAAEGKTAQSAHQQQTFGFAEQALARDQQFAWQLLKQPQRLRIMTIDALCQMLSQAIPLPDKQLPYAEVSEDPYPYYQQAVRQCLAYALAEETLQPACMNLLDHLDNRQDKLIELFTDLLATRDQWLETICQARQLQQATLEQALAAIEQHELTRLVAATPKHLRDELSKLGRQLAMIENDPDSPRFALQTWQHFDQLDRTIAAALHSALLKTDGELRLAFDHYVGLRKGVCADSVYQQLKADSKALLADLANQADFKAALQRVGRLPSPSYDVEQWQVLQDLLNLLPLMAAYLQVIFSQHNRCDFTAVAHQAVDALGDEQQPTDLLLYLDNSIHHLLVDEFQDTSIQQTRLLHKLIQGWQSGDGRTLFIVGDPMQSIYRFRQAEVGLFLKVKQQGLNELPMQALQLSCNFRSSKTIVDWVNQHFNSIFPAQDDIESGAISFHESLPIHEELPHSMVVAQQWPNRQQEAQAVVELISQELSNYPQDNIAILVRSRSHLEAIVRLLRKQQIPFQGVDIEPLAALPHVRDIWSLTKALLFPADRIAWLALLRSPWCGLSLIDLHWLANVEKKRSIYHALQHAEQLPLSAEGLIRLRYFTQVINEAFALRQQQSLVEWLTNTAERLQRDLILSCHEKHDLEQFWQLLDKHNRDGQIADLVHFEQAFNQLYSQNSSPSRLQIMTIHKSKGLEFDCVILPGLGNRPPNRDQALLRWMNLPSQQQDDLLLISPIRAAHKKECLVYNYLASLDAEKEQYELQRLLYVAATRAKKRLYLFDNQDNAHKKSTLRALLMQQEFAAHESTESIIDQTPLPILKKLPTEYYLQPPAKLNHDMNHMVLTEFGQHTRQIGIITHELLQWIGTHHPQHRDQLPWPSVYAKLRLAGLNEEQFDQAIRLIRQQINLVFEDDVGQWIMQAHDQEACELELLVQSQGEVTTRIIDRSFCDRGVRWVIDFKTGSDDLNSQEQHKQQVEGYARLLATSSAEPIHCGLYYLASGHWLNWQFAFSINEITV